MRSSTVSLSSVSRLALTLAVLNVAATSAVLIQHNNYMLDDSDMIGGQAPDASSFAPFAYDQGVEHSADGDIIGSMGRSLFAKMLQDDQDQGANQEQGSQSLNQELAELLAATQQQQQQQSEQQMANGEQKQSADGGVGSSSDLISSPGDQIAELNASLSSGGLNAAVAGSPSVSSLQQQPSKMELKASGQWFNPKEIIPVLKISSMAKPSKYKKVYFRSEKKLVDGAFHAQPAEPEKKSMLKQFNSGVQRRSSKASSAGGSPPSMFQDGVLEFLRKFRDVYVQSRPVSPPKTNLASSVMSAAASSPIISMLLPPSSSSSSSSSGKPNFANALSAASSMINSAAMLAQASNAAATSASAPSASSSASAQAPASAAGSGAAAAGSGTSAASGSKRPVVTGQTYVQFWSKTFPDWVRKMLKQMRRRSLHNSAKRHQQNHHQHSAANSIGQASQASGAGSGSANAVERASSGGAGSSAQ